MLSKCTVHRGGTTHRSDGDGLKMTDMCIDFYGPGEWAKLAKSLEKINKKPKRKP